MIITSNEDMECMLANYKYKTTLYKEADGSITAASDIMDLAENAPDKEAACKRLAEAILEYAEEYYSVYKLYSRAPNRRAHLPYVVRAILLGTPESIMEEMVCRSGKI